MGKWWGKGWIWLAIGLFIAIYAAMSLMGSRTLNQLRWGMGMPSSYGQAPQGDPLGPEELEALLNRLQPAALAAIGFGGFAVIAWLMFFKPF